MVFIDNLDMVWSLVSANLVGLEQINSIDVRRDMEVPGSEGVISEAMHGLICPYLGLTDIVY